MPLQEGTMMKRSICLLAVFISFVTISTIGFSNMTPTTGGLTVEWGETGTEFDWNSWTAGTTVVDNGDGTFTIDDNEGWAQNGCDVEYIDLLYKSDPFVQGGFAVTNTSTTLTQTFTFTFTTPVSPMLTGSTLYGGSMSGSLTVDPVNGGTVSTVTGTPLFEGFIDGASYLSFHPTGSWSDAGLLGGGDGSESIPAGNQPVTLSGPSPVTTDLEIVFTFTLTPGDVATMNGRLEVIPEPATMVLLGLGALLLRRKK
jgi:hypothetical protein